MISKEQMQFVDDGEANNYTFGIKKDDDKLSDWTMKVQFNGKLTYSEQEQICNLIACAPEMLEALERFYNEYENNPTQDEVTNNILIEREIHKIIQKAKGETNG